MALKTVFRTQLTQTWTAAADGDPLGDIRWENNKAYKCVLYSIDDSLTVAAGDVVFYFAVTGYIANTVTADLSASNNQGAGIILSTITVDDTYMWIQLTGLATLNTPFDGTVEPGDGLTAKAALDKTLTISALVDDFIVASALVDANDTIICAFPF